ncbi:hypothetical protein OIU85_029974 [Salix viminalis]|uniref:Reverse transcriptase zinc-binding domain-containing protein n=1 Tax=Salix viminalis TaxID=40686 RepID=A0A9Q0QCU6_SALVM|nr:hypothetical protein OIU85_029974 [Salix viminalis]
MHDQNLWPTLPWSQLLEWASNEFRSPKLISHKIGPLILAATVYHIWQERNQRVFNNSARSVQAISLELFWQIRDKISNLGTQSSILEATRSYGLQAASLGFVFRRGAPPSQMGVGCSLWALLSGWLVRWVPFKGGGLVSFVRAS